MMKSKTLMATLAMALAGSVAWGDVVAWYRFGELDSGVAASAANKTIVNAASPGVHDLEMGSYSGTTVGFDASLVPYGTSSLGSTLLVHDPLTGIAVTNNRAMHFGSRSSRAGKDTAPGSCARVATKPDDAIGRLTNVTVEVIFRLKDDAPQSGTFPLVQRSGAGDYQPNWGLTVNSSGLWQRFQYTTNGVNATTAENFVSGSQLTRGVWHHGAFTFGSDGKARLYLDYAEAASWTCGPHAKLRTYTDAKTLAIGYRPNVSNSTFDGEIDEIRISDTALLPAQFLHLRQGVENLDPDTAFYAPLDYDEGVLPASSLDINAATNQNGLVGRFYYEGDAVTKSRPTSVPDVTPGTNGILRQNAFAVDQANLGSIYCQTNVPGKGTCICVETPDRALFKGSFTAEMFFKGDRSKINTSGTAITLFYGQCKVLLVANGKSVTCRAYVNEYSYVPSTSEFSGTCNVWDDNWHHVAFVYDYAASNVVLYLDYKLVGSTLESSIKKQPIRLYEGRSGHTKFYFGMQNDTDRQFFPGWIDSPRIVRRALRPTEFLSKMAKHADETTLAHMAFDDETWRVTPYTDLVQLDHIEARTGGKKPVIDTGMKFGGVYLDGAARQVMKPDVASVLMDGSMVCYAFTELFEQSSFTLEFFSKFETLPKINASLVRLNRGTQNWATYSTWSPSVQSTGELFFHYYLVRADGSFNDASPSIPKAFSADRRWHHYAFTASYSAEAGTTTITCYRDYEPLGEAITAEGRFYCPSTGTCLSLGPGGNGVDSNFRGWINELRFSKGVLPVSSFLRAEKRGMAVMMK